MEDNYLRLPIIPGVGASGVTLGEAKETLEQKLGTSSTSTQLQSGGEKLDYGSVKLWLDGGKVNQIGVYRGYIGRTQDGVGVGLSEEELKGKWGFDLAWHENEEMWEFLSKPGIGFTFEKEGESAEKISAIFIYSKEK